MYPANMYHGFDSENETARRGLITRSALGHDLDRPVSRGCGFIRERGSTGDGGIRFTACYDNPEHYARGRRSHCWSLHCHKCMNDTALRMGSRVEGDSAHIASLCRSREGIQDLSVIGSCPPNRSSRRCRCRQSAVTTASAEASRVPCATAVPRPESWSSILGDSRPTVGLCHRTSIRSSSDSSIRTGSGSCIPDWLSRRSTPKRRTSPSVRPPRI